MKPCDVHGQLTLAMGAHRLAVYAEREHLTVELQHWRTALRLWRQGTVLPNRSRLLEGVRVVLLHAGLTIHIRLAGRTVARLGAQARPNFSARLLRLSPFELRPFMLGWAYLQRSRQHLAAGE
jgi:hypothetical protein